MTSGHWPLTDRVKLFSFKGVRNGAVIFLPYSWYLSSVTYESVPNIWSWRFSNFWSVLLMAANMCLMTYDTFGNVSGVFGSSSSLTAFLSCLEHCDDETWVERIVKLLNVTCKKDYLDKLQKGILITNSFLKQLLLNETRSFIKDIKIILFSMYSTFIN